MILALKLVLAHIIGDFLLQPTYWVRDKKIKKHRSKYLYLHIVVHAIVLGILLFDLRYWKAFLFIIVTHLIIDIIKLHLSAKVVERWLFFWDQLAHLMMIVLVIRYYESAITFFSPDQIEKYFLVLICILLLTTVGSTIIRMMISKWVLEEDAAGHSLNEAGKYIGMLERLFVFGFIISGHIEAIGFLIAAKSVFRFGDLSKSKDRKLTEYILIGTLMSFGLAMLIGAGYIYLRSKI